MQEDITDPIKLKKLIDNLHNQIDKYERQMRKLTKAQDILKLEKERSMHMAFSCKGDVDKQQALINMQKKQIMDLENDYDNLKKQLQNKKNTSILGGGSENNCCIIS